MREEFETLHLHRADGVVTMTLNRPQKKNAMNGRLFAELLEAIRQVQDREEDRVLVVTGAGGDFCSGADLSAPFEPDKHPLERMRIINETPLALHRLTKPAIAKVRGVAVGAGFNLALGCDLVVAAEDARFCQIFVRRGLSIDFGGSWLLPRLVGLHKAKELALLTEMISAREAKDLGVVNRVVPDGELDRFVDEWARRLAAGPPIALAQTKRMLNDSLLLSMEQALEGEGRAQAANLATADAAEAHDAFLARRDPVFTGKSALGQGDGVGG